MWISSSSTPFAEDCVFNSFVVNPMVVAMWGYFWIFYFIGLHIFIPLP
jgi:hypothetical protein